MTPPRSDTDPSYVAQDVGPVYVLAHRRGGASHLVEAMCAELVSMARRYPEGCGAILVLHEGATPPDTAARKRFVQMFERDRDTIRAFAVLVLGSGFWAAAVRSVVSLLGLTSRLPIRIFSDESSAAQWVLDCLGGPAEPDAEALVAAIATCAGGPNEPISRMNT